VSAGEINKAERINSDYRKRYFVHTFSNLIMSFWVDGIVDDQKKSGIIFGKYAQGRQRARNIPATDTWS
jgi:hypothetical protein